MQGLNLMVPNARANTFFFLWITVNACVLLFKIHFSSVKKMIMHIYAFGLSLIILIKLCKFIFCVSLLHILFVFTNIISSCVDLWIYTFIEYLHYLLIACTMPLNVNNLSFGISY